MDQVVGAETPVSVYRGLYRLGGGAALLVAVLTVAELITFMVFPQPGTAHGWFLLFQTRPIVGLLDFWGLEVPMYAMFVLVFLALYVVLRKINQSWMTIALCFALLGSGVFFATNNPFSMLTLSRRFAAATTEADRSVILAAGEALLANTNQRAVGGFNIALFLVNAAGLIVSAVMRKAPTFRRGTAQLGLLAFGCSLADYLRQAFTSSPIIALFVILAGAILIVLWFARVGRRLLQLGRCVGAP